MDYWSEYRPDAPTKIAWLGNHSGDGIVQRLMKNGCLLAPTAESLNFPVRLYLLTAGRGGTALSKICWTPLQPLFGRSCGGLLEIL